MFKKLLPLVLLIVILSNTGFSIRMPQFRLPEPSILNDINGQPVRGLTEPSRVSVNLDEISPFFLKAIIAVEDKRFYQHHGVDVQGLIRAAYIDIKAGKVIEGGSTITQQTAKNVFLSNERTWSRKIKELYYAIMLESKYSKDEILMMYCNTIYFGQGAYGVETAARTFFGRKASDLTLAQASLLAGIPRWPSHYDPYVNPQAARERQEVVLQRMVEDKKITAADKDKAWPSH
jgi:membrane peptidoglycan carboxypeptidase